MTKTIILTILIAGVFVLGSLATNEAFAAGYMKLGDIKGESTAPGHQNEIDIESWSWGETNSGTSAAGGGGGAGKVSMQDFHFTMNYNKASPKLMEAVANGQHIPEAKLTLRKAGGEPSGDRHLDYLVITMKNVLVSSYSTGGSSEQIPTDSISLNFAEIEFKYIPQNERGDPEPAVTGSASKHGRR